MLQKKFKFHVFNAPKQWEKISIKLYVFNSVSVRVCLSQINSILLQQHKRTSFKHQHKQTTWKHIYIYIFFCIDDEWDVDDDVDEDDDGDDEGNRSDDALEKIWK